jgi:sulfite exporter TauE/SafE
LSYLIPFLIGLLSSAHCVGMCGGFAASVAAPPSGAGTAPGQGLRMAIPYHAGRLLTLAARGAVMGAVGSFVDAAGRLAGWQRLATCLGGVLMIAWALAYFRGQSLFGSVSPGFLAARWPRARRLLFAPRCPRGPLGAFTAGLLLGFMPCGLLATVEIRAAATGSPWAGAGTMLSFGAGTVPALLGWAALAGAVMGRWRPRLDRTAAALVGVVGMLSLLRGLAASGVVSHVNPWLW